MLEQLGTAFTPDTNLRRHRELVARHWDYRGACRGLGTSLPLAEKAGIVPGCIWKPGFCSIDVDRDCGSFLSSIIQMKNLDRYEQRILSAYDKGELVSVRPTKAQLVAFRESARATFTKNRRVNIRLSTADLMDIQARAHEDGVPCQTLIASVLHK